MNKKSLIIFAISFIAVCAIMLGIIYLAGSAGAGIGPNGFAYYARQGIINIINKTYGKGNSPYNVICTDHPNYIKISDRVICNITLRPL